jgi:hypothetical protein
MVGGRGGGGCHALHDATSFPSGSSLVSLSVGTLMNYSTVSCTHSEQYQYLTLHAIYILLTNPREILFRKTTVGSAESLAL